ncbi:MAG: hypothetical protein CR988_00215 [Treponema sp.]|nr:MAG: hypothetical protein CR988_00215 [Treponema sp.]
MIKKDLVEKSPVRDFEKALGGGLKAGELGVVTSKKGVGKTSMLVQLGLDELLQEQRVFHISFSQHVDYAVTWYSDMYDELSKKKNLENAEEIKSKMLANRVILNFNQDTVLAEQIMKTVKALCEGGSKPNALMVDDFDFSKASHGAIKKIRDFAKEEGFSIWFTARADVRDANIAASLEDFIDDLDVVLYLTPEQNVVKIIALKDRERKDVDTGCKFDIKTMLLV